MAEIIAAANSLTLAGALAVCVIAIAAAANELLGCRRLSGAAVWMDTQHHWQMGQGCKRRRVPTGFPCRPTELLAGIKPGPLH